MTLPAFITWDFDPVLFTLFGHPIVWYGLLFALGLIILGPWIEKKMWEHEKLDRVPGRLCLCRYYRRSAFGTCPIL